MSRIIITDANREEARLLAARGPVALATYQTALRAVGIDLLLFEGRPGRWLAEGLDGELYDFPATGEGWKQRVRVATKGVIGKPAHARQAIGTGWPMVDQAAMLSALDAL